jgi:nucleotide-binding universal stress UspA family protein
MKILMAVDGSPYTQHLLDYLKAQPDWRQSSHHYTVVHVTAAVPPRAASALGRELLDSYYEEEAEKVFEPVRASLKDAGLQADFVKRVGHAAEEVVKTAQDTHADLIMMGSRGHGSFGSLVLGSVASKVLSECKTPVLLVRG